MSLVLVRLQMFKQFSNVSMRIHIRSNHYILSSSYQLLQRGTFYHSRRRQRVYIYWQVDLLLFFSARTNSSKRMSTDKYHLKFNAHSILQICTLSGHITLLCDQIYRLERLRLPQFCSIQMFQGQIYKGH